MHFSWIRITIIFKVLLNHPHDRVNSHTSIFAPPSSPLLDRNILSFIRKCRNCSCPICKYFSFTDNEVMEC